MAVAQFNSEENKSNILKLPKLTNSVKAKQKIADSINWSFRTKAKKQNIIWCEEKKAVQLKNQKTFKPEINNNLW